VVRSTLLVVLLVALPAGAASQVVVGLAADAQSGAPLDGAFVTLSDENGVPNARSLTNASGRFSLRAPASGRYHLRIERIGYQAIERTLTVEQGRAAEITLRLVPQAIPLEGITVETTSRCEIRPETGRLTARLWDDVGTALRVARWSESEGLLRFRLVKWERELDPRSLEIRAESRNEEVRTLDRSPFASRPASELQELGYVREDEDGYLSFYAPDATVLLSDEFLDGHNARSTLVLGTRSRWDINSMAHGSPPLE